MNTIIRLGFIVWRLRHGGCRHFTHARKSFIRDCEFRVILLLREQII